MASQRRNPEVNRTTDDRRLSKDTRSSAVLWLAPAVVFAGLVAVQWRGQSYFPGTDAIAYIVGGVNLVATGSFTNAAGRPELWFPPLYPLLIGAVSLGGRLDPTSAAHAISVVFAIAGLFLTGYLARLAGGRGYEPVLAMALLALNPIHQGAALFALSESTATFFALCAFAIWLRLRDESSLWPYAAIGLIVGLSYLTRPEGVLLLPFWAAIDLLRAKARRPIFLRYAAAGLVMALVALPYVVYLYRHTGKVTLTGKTAINLTSGRATYFGQPTEYIDPDTLEVGLWQYDLTVMDEAGRFAWNAARIAASYARHLMLILAVPILVGFLSFAGDRRLRFLLGGAIFVAYLIVLVVFQVKDRFLHLSLPFLSILAARGLTQLLGPSAASLDRRPPPSRAAIAAALGLAVIAQSGRIVLANRVDRSGSPLLREAGERLRQIAPARGVVYDQWAHVAFNAGHESRIITPNDARTLLRYMEKHARPGQPIYLALSSMEAPFYDPSLRALLDSADEFPQLKRLFSLSDDVGTVVVYEVRVKS
jgi:hypothetical protein